MVSALTAALGFALAVTFWPGHAGAAEWSRWEFIAIIVSVTLCFVRIRMTPAHWALVFLLGWAALSLLWSPVFDDALGGFLRLVFIGAAFAIGSKVSNPKHLYRGLGIGLAVSSAIAIAQLLGYQPVDVAPGNAAPAGLFVNSNVLGWAAAPVFVMLLAQRDWWFAAAVLPALLLSNCRIADVAAIACAGVLVWQWNRVGAVLGALSLVVLFARPQMFDAHSLLQRSDLWLDALGGWTFFGHGIGSFYSAFPLHNPRVTVEQAQFNAWIEVAHAHNDYIEFVFELGVLGSLLAGGVLLHAWRYGRQVEHLGLLCIGITALAGFPLYQPFTAALFAFLAGHAAGGRHRVCRAEYHGRSALHAGIERTGVGAAASGGAAVPA